MRCSMIALLLTIWALPAPSESSGASDNKNKFMAVFNGQYNNLPQYQDDNTSYSYIQLRNIPVTTPALPGRVVFFNEWSYDGKVLNLQLVDIKVNKKGVIHLVLYNFTDPSQYKFGEYNVDDVSKLKPGDLKLPPTCRAQFRPNGRAGFEGSWQDCRHYTNGKPDLYAVTMTCTEVEVVIPRAAFEKSPDLPYHLVLKGDKFPEPGVPDNFVSPCN